MMSGSKSRDKGCRGEAEARAVLGEHDFAVIEQPRGRATCDCIAHKDGTMYAVEVKYAEAITLAKWRKQAREQGKALKMPWLLMVRLPGHPRKFYVEGANVEPSVWRGR